MKIMRLFAAILVYVSLVTIGITVNPSHAEAQTCKKGNTGKIIGGVFGAVAGGVLGSKIDKKGSTGTIVGALVGAFAGSQIGKKLDKCQQEAVATSAQESIETNKYGRESRRPVKDPYGDGSIGYTETVSRTSENGVECRIQRTVVVDPATGEDIIQPIKQCRTGPNGGFQPSVANV